MADGNIIEFILRLVTDKASFKQGQDALAGVGGGSGIGISQKEIAAEVASYQKMLGGSTSQAASALSTSTQVSATGKVWQATYAQIMQAVKAEGQFVSEEQAASAAAAQVSKNTKQTAEDVKTISLLMTGRALSRVGGTLTTWGRDLLTNPINAYVKQAGYSSGASAEWLAAQQKLEQSTVRLGAVLAQQVAPVMSKMADFASQVSGLFDKYPELAGAVSGIAGLAIVAGLALQLSGQTILAVNAANKLIAWATTRSVATAAAQAAAGGAAAGAATTGATVTVGSLMSAYVLPVLPAVIAAVVAYFALKNIKLPGQSEDIWTQGTRAGAQVNALASYAVGYMTGGPEQANQNFLNASKAAGLLGDSAKQAADNLDKITAAAPGGQAGVDAFIAFQKAETDAAKQGEAQRLQIVQDSGKQMADAEASYQQKRQSVIANIAQDAADAAQQNAKRARNFYQQDAQAETDYYNERTKSAANHNKEDQRAEEDHQRRMLEMQQEHALKVEDLLTNRDYFGLLTESRDYEKNRQKEESGYQVETARRDQDWAQQLAEMDANFTQQRARRYQDYAEQNAEAAQQTAMKQAQRQQELKDLDVQHKAEMVQIEADKQAKLVSLQQQLTSEQQARYAAFAGQLRDLNVALGNETNLRQQYYALWTKQYQDFINQNSGGLANAAKGNLPGHASGGYVSGAIMTGERGIEYLLNNGEVSLLERLNGGRLQPGSIYNMLARGMGGTTIVVNNQNRYDGRISARDRAEIDRMQMDSLSKAFA